MILLTLLFFVFSYANGFTIEFPYGTNFMARVKNINLNKINDQTKSDLQYLFKTTPVLVFEKQELIPEEQYYISTFFDTFLKWRVFFQKFLKGMLIDHQNQEHH